MAHHTVGSWVQHHDGKTGWYDAKVVAERGEGEWREATHRLPARPPALGGGSWLTGSGSSSRTQPQPTGDSSWPQHAQQRKMARVCVVCPMPCNEQVGWGWELRI